MTNPALPIPPRLARRPLHRGFPVPYINLNAPDGTPDFRAVDEHKRLRVAANQLCAMCAEALGRFRFFVGGPQAALHLSYFEPPVHLDCLLFGLQTCPYILGQVEHADVHKVADKHAGYTEVVREQLVRDDHWKIVKATGQTAIPNGASWNLRPLGVLLITPPLYPERMTPAQWAELEALLRQ